MNFEQNLKKVMQEKNVTVSQLSQITGIGKSSISQYCSGKNKPTVARITLIADALGCSTKDLVTDQAEPEVTAANAGDKKVYNLPVKTAAKLLGCTDKFLYHGLQVGAFPWGYAVKQSGIWTYFINASKFAEQEGVQI